MPWPGLIGTAQHVQKAHLGERRQEPGRFRDDQKTGPLIAGPLPRGDSSRPFARVTVLWHRLGWAGPTPLYLKGIVAMGSGTYLEGGGGG